MEIDDFPGCCTAAIFSNFDDHDGWGYNPTKETILKHLKREKADGKAIVVVTLTNHQKETYKLLKNIGFKFTRPISKSHHPENKLRLGWFLLEELK